MKSIAIRFLLPCCVVGLAFATLILYRSYIETREHAYELVHQQAALALEYNLAIREYAATTIRPFAEGKVDKDSFLPEVMSTSVISRNIYDQVHRRFPTFVIRFASDDPRNPRNRANADELRLIAFFREHPEADRKTEEITIDGQTHLAHFVPKRVKPECLRCHGNPKDAPAALLQTYGNSGSFYRALGDVAGIDTVAVPVEPIKAALSAELRRQAAALAGVFVLLFGMVTVIFRLVVSRRLKRISRHFNEIAADVKSPSMRPVDPGAKDEIGVLAGAFNSLLTQLRNTHASLEQRVRQRTSELSDANKELVEVTRTDRLTGLANRNRLQDRLQEAILRAGKEPFRFAILFIDLDSFKLVNDSLGHEVGDELLVETAHRLRSVVRTDDTIAYGSSGNVAARLGGDEFILLLNDLQQWDDAALVAGRLLQKLAQPYMIQGREMVCSASIGIVTNEVPVERAEEMIRDADTAMYEAKQAGKDRYVVFDESMRRRVRDYLALVTDLRKAMEADQLELHYQPIVSLQSNRVESFEALVRWRHPQRGFVSPAEFIPAAEKSGLIAFIDEWVFRQAARQLAQWRRDGGVEAPASLNVNVSRHLLMSPDLPSLFGSILQETGIEPEAIHLEITESAVMRDPQLATHVLGRLREMGFRIYMDDFGTGYSSLGCLHQFPIDVLKIDQAFTANTQRGKSFVDFVTAIVAMAGSLRILVVAEGVETPEQLTLLRSLGCQFAQGYLIAKPLPADRAAGFIAAHRRGIWAA